MSGAKVLDLGSASDFTNLDFSDLEVRFERLLNSVKTSSDLDALIRTINPLFKRPQYSSDEILRLKKLRQRAYDQRKQSKINPANQNTKKTTNQAIKFSDMDASQNSLSANASPSIVRIATRSENRKRTFGQGVKDALETVDGETFIKAVPKILTWFNASATVSFFLWQQSFNLYKSAGFENAVLASLGGIIMLIGFAAYHSITRSWLAIFLCMYVGAYESYLMISGTINDDAKSQEVSVTKNPELLFLQQKAEREHPRYLELKQRYDNPDEKVFKNDWFLKNHLNPSWNAHAQAQEELAARTSSLLRSAKTIDVTWLKIFYRLGLVFLCMVLVHRFFNACRSI